MYFYRRTALAITAALVSATAWAQQQTWVVPFPAGSSTDVIARNVAKELEASEHWTIIIDNRPGAGGGIAANYVARQKPGSDIYFVGTVANSVGVSYYGKTVPHLTRDLEPIVQFTTAPFVIAASAAGNLGSFKALLDGLKSGKLKEVTFGSGGNGTANHLAGEMLAKATGFRFVHVPYKGAANAAIDVAGGRLDLVIGSIIDIGPMTSSGKLVALATTSAKRVDAYPDVPTVSELIPGYAAVGWHGLFAPKGTDARTLARINGAVNKILKQSTVADELRKLGATAASGDRADFTRFVEKDMAQWASSLPDQR